MVAFYFFSERFEVQREIERKVRDSAHIPSAPTPRTWTHQKHRSLREGLGVACAVGSDNCIRTGTHHCSTKQSIFTAGTGPGAPPVRPHPGPVPGRPLTLWLSPQLCLFQNAMELESSNVTSIAWPLSHHNGHLRFLHGFSGLDSSLLVSTE